MGAVKIPPTTDEELSQAIAAGQAPPGDGTPGGECAVQF